MACSIFKKRDIKKKLNQSDHITQHSHTTHHTEAAYKISFLAWLGTSENDATVFRMPFILVLPLQLYLGREI